MIRGMSLDFARFSADKFSGQRQDTALTLNHLQHDAGGVTGSYCLLQSGNIVGGDVDEAGG